MKDDLQSLLTNVRCFPIEITLTSGDKITITHPDFVFYSRKLNRVYHFPRGEGTELFEWFPPEQIAKVRGKDKRSAA